jgi:hypothetical protein
MQHPFRSWAGIVLFGLAAIDVTAMVAGLYADGPSFFGWLWASGRRAVSGLTPDITVMLAGMALFVWAQFGDRIRSRLGSRQVGVGLSEVNSRLESLERGIQSNDRKIEDLHGDGVVLLDAASYVIILELIRDLLRRSPTLQDASRHLESSDESLKNQIAVAEDYRKLTREKLGGTYHWYEFKLALDTAGGRAANALSGTPAAERPQALDPYLVQRYVVARAQCDQAVVYLKRALEEGESKRGYYLSRISEQMRLKQPSRSA